jgi:3-deoxy-D-manno-octulosonate 8-phosphate phosphatase (KDO 8-P phosphatase)
MSVLPTQPADALPSLRPALNFAPELLLRAQGIKVAFFDVDGVLTDGGLYFSEQGPRTITELPGERYAVGESIKRFSTLDGQGLKLLQMAGITPVVISGRDSLVLRARLQALGIVHVHLGTEDKRPAAELALAALSCTWGQAAAMGDDWPDLPVMRRAAISCAPVQAHIEARAVAHYITQSAGGHGAAREFCDLLLVASGRYAALLEGYSA